MSSQILEVTISIILLLLILNVVHMKVCYWNAKYHYNFFGSKTAYDTIRGDIRDHVKQENCEEISIWSLHRHGNRNPGYETVPKMLPVINEVKDKIIASFEAGSSKLCAQDIDNLRKWTWNTSIESSMSHLTGIGYEELYSIGKRIRQKYSDLFHGTEDQFYLRSTNQQRTRTSCHALVHGLTDGINLKVTYEEPRQIEDVVRPYEYCERFQDNLKTGPMDSKIAAYYESPDYISVMKSVQRRLGISIPLSAVDVFAMYDLCRYHCSWRDNGQDPWCSVFTKEDLATLEYFDDVKRYYKEGYGSWMNVELGKVPLKDLYQNFEAAVNGVGKKLVSYCTHDTMMLMTWSAMGLFKDNYNIDSVNRESLRTWRTSFIGSFATNMIAVLLRCSQVNEVPHYKVQLFINERETPICPSEGCHWHEFQNLFQNFTLVNTEFCKMNNVQATSMIEKPWSDSESSAESEIVFNKSLEIMLG